MNEKAYLICIRCYSIQNVWIQSLLPIKCIKCNDYTVIPIMKLLTYWSISYEVLSQGNLKTLLNSLLFHNRFVNELYREI